MHGKKPRARPAATAQPQSTMTANSRNVAESVATCAPKLWLVTTN